jgi:hypothetical protein
MVFRTILALAMSATVCVVQAADKPIDIGSRLELFVDDWLIDRLEGAQRRLHHPVPAEVAVVCDRPWEGNGCNEFTCLRDDGLYRMYYSGGRKESLTKKPAYKQGTTKVTGRYTCYAESRDGITWTRPSLGLFKVAGTRDNNVVLTQDVAGYAVNNFCPFVDTRPDVPPEERYKALGGMGGGLLAFVSPDGIRWSKLRDAPVITKGGFDSKNLPFWDAERKEYRAYARDRRIEASLREVKDAPTLKTSATGLTSDGRDNGRDIITCTSKDFIHWTEPRFLSYSPGRINELYENNVLPYYRAPHLLLGFPVRYIDRGWNAAAEALPQPVHRQKRARLGTPREGTALTDCMLMSSRDRTHFSVWPESFIRPGLRSKDNWFYGDNFPAQGMIETASAIIGAPNELSLFATEAYSQPGPVRLRRFTIRVDGFVSISAPLSGGEVITRPLLFSGSELLLNYSTSAAGSVQVEVQDAQGIPIPGFTLADAVPLYGDSLEQPALWREKSDLGTLAGVPVRLRFVLSDADVYSIRFRKTGGS